MTDPSLHTETAEPEQQEAPGLALVPEERRREAVPVLWELQMEEARCRAREP